VPHPAGGAYNAPPDSLAGLLGGLFLREGRGGDLLAVVSDSFLRFLALYKFVRMCMRVCILLRRGRGGEGGLAPPNLKTKLPP